MLVGLAGTRHEVEVRRRNKILSDKIFRQKLKQYVPRCSSFSREKEGFKFGHSGLRITDVCQRHQKEMMGGIEG